MKPRLQVAFAAVTIAGLFWPAKSQATLELGGGPPPSDAPLVSELPSGSEYQIAFVTSGTDPATSTSIPYYNDFVTQQAAQSPSLPIGVSWSAIASTASAAANTNAVTYNSVGIYNTEGQLLADGKSFYGAALLNPVFDEFGGSYNGPVWTGSNADGTQSFAPLGDWFEFPTGSGDYDSPLLGSLSPAFSNSGGAWLHALEFSGTSIGQEVYPLYALSTRITVVPEPSGGLLALAALATLGVAIATRRLRSRSYNGVVQRR